jgi:hypothetical protein
LLTTAIYVEFIYCLVDFINQYCNLHYYHIIILLSKPRINGVFTFEAFTTYFISALIGLVLSVGFNMILFNVDPGAQDTIKEITIKYD